MFSRRSHNKELLDGEAIPYNDLALNLKELHTINRWLGGYRVSRSAFRRVLRKDRPAVVVDIGSGGGDTLREIKKWANSEGYRMKLYGIDHKQDCIAYSAGISAGSEGISFICDDYRKALEHVADAEILHASLFCHHLSDEEIGGLIAFAREKKLTLIINDLERHPVAYYSIKWLTRLLSSSRLVKNDAPLSVLRGFTAREWKQLIEKAGVPRYTIRSKWAFRHEVIIYND
jgi:hypothetical protein